MLAKKFDLGMYHLGNGTTVISAAGNIKFYVPEDYIPPEDMARIRSCADSDKAKFRADFEKMDKYEQYGAILDRLNHADFMRVTADKRPFDERLPELREYYYSIA